MGKKIVRWNRKNRNTIDSDKTFYVKTGESIFNFNTFKNSVDFASNIYHKDKTYKQYKMFGLLNDLKEYEPKNFKKVKSKEEALTSAEKLYNNRDNVIKAFENGFFPFKDWFQ